MVKRYAELIGIRTIRDKDKKPYDNIIGNETNLS
jgi:hypothetical protein